MLLMMSVVLSILAGYISDLFNAIKGQFLVRKMGKAKQPVKTSALARQP